MAKIVWIDLGGNKQESEEYIDIKSFRSYIEENRYFIKVVELLDCKGLSDLYDKSTSSGLFEDCKNLVEVKEVVGTSDAKHMDGMFNGCRSLKSVPLFITSTVENMSFMFSDCSSLESVPLFDTTNVKFRVDMFDGCDNLKSYILPCNEYNTRSSIIKAFEDYKKSENLLKTLKEHLEGQ